MNHLIIYIDRTISEYLEDHKLSNVEKQLFYGLALCHHHGKCFLCGDIKSLSALHRCIDRFDDSLYGTVLSRYTELKSIADLVDSVLVVTFGQNPTVPEFIKSKMRVLRVQEIIDNNLDISQDCSFVGENLSDCAFYSLIAERYARLNQLRGITISFRHENGGGDTTYQVFEARIKTAKVPTFCLVDSDYRYGPTEKYPDFPEPGTTAKKVEDTIADLNINLPLYELYEVPIHEAENLIPIDVLEKISLQHKQMVPGISILKKIRDIGRGDAILYYDFKKGIHKFENNASQAYWSEIGDLVQDHTFPAILNRGLLSYAVGEMSSTQETGSKFVVNIELDAYLLDLWIQIGRKVFSWGCASVPVRA